MGVVGIPGGWSSARLADAFAGKTGFRCLIDMRRVVLDFDRDRALYDGLDLGSLDALVVKKVGVTYSPDLLDRLTMLRFLHQRGVPVFSNPSSMMAVLDRLSCTVTLRLAGVPMPPTVITEDFERAVEAVEGFCRSVLKPLYTSKARGMRVVEAGAAARQQIAEFRAAGNEVLYVQKMLDLPGRDLGVAFLGGAFLGCYARAGDGRSWNTTTRSGGRYQRHEPSQEVLDLAHKAQALFDLDFTSVDIAETENGPVVFEVSAFGGFRGLMEVNHIDAADLYADYVLERLSDAD